MTLKIDDFKSQVGKGGGIAMGNLYKIFLPPINGDAREMNLLCKATSLPGRQILSTEKQMGLDQYLRLHMVMQTKM